MARIRTIKPDFFTDERIAALSPLARLLFVGLWCEADREGRLEWRLKTLKWKYLPEDDCDIELIGKELIDAGRVVIYVAGSKLCAVIPSFCDHQHVNVREPASKLPAPPSAKPVRARAKRVLARAMHEPEPDAAVKEDAGPVIAPQEGKGMEGKGTGMEGKEEQEGVGADAPPALPSEDLETPAYLDQTPAGQAVKRFNTIAERIGLPACQKLGDDRRRLLNARLLDCGGLDGWDVALAKLEGSKFCQGGNDRQWRASIDFLLHPKKFTKLMEGNYDDRTDGSDEAIRRAVLEGSGVTPGMGLNGRSAA